MCRNVFAFLFIGCFSARHQRVHPPVPLSGRSPSPLSDLLPATPRDFPAARLDNRTAANVIADAVFLHLASTSLCSETHRRSLAEKKREDDVSVCLSVCLSQSVEHAISKRKGNGIQGEGRLECEPRNLSA